MLGIMNLGIVYVLLALSAALPFSGSLPINFTDIAFEAVRDIVEEIGAGSSPVSIVSGDTIQSDIIWKFSVKTQLSSGLLIFSVKLEDEIPQLIPSLQKLRQLTKDSLFVVIGDFTEVTPMIDILFQENLLLWPTKLLVISSLQLATKISQNQKKILSDSNSMILHPTAENLSRWSLYLYLPFSHRAVQVSVWSPHRRLVKVPSQKLFPDKFVRLSDGGHLSATTVLYPPQTHPAQVYRGFHEQREDIPVSGPVLEALTVLSNAMNFTFSVYFAPDGAFGYRFQNGSWGGMVGQLVKKKADIALQLLSITYSRAQVIDYTNVVMTAIGRILARRGETEINPWGYFLPLSQEVWLCGLLSLMLVMTASFVLSVTGVSSGTHLEYPLDNYIRMLLSQTVITQIGNKWSRRTVVATWLIGTLIVVKGYSGNLSSLLTVRYVPQLHHSVRAVVDDPEVTAVTTGGGSIEQTLHSFKSGVFKELVDSESRGKLIYVKFPQLYDVISQKVARGTHALIGEDLPMRLLTTRHFAEEGSCLFYFSREKFFSQILAFAVQKNSPLASALNQRIPMLTESGLYSHWMDRVFANASSCNKAPSKIVVESSLSLHNVWGMFVTLGCGYLISFCIFHLELLSMFLQKVFF